MTETAIEPTAGEHLELTRRRAGLSQRAFADLLGVPVTRLRRWERDYVEAPLDVTVDELRPNEWCFLQRKRAGLRLLDVAEDLSVRQTWVHRAERGELRGDQLGALVAYWLRRLGVQPGSDPLASLERWQRQPPS